MAAKTRWIEGKTNVFWTKDPDISDSQIVKVHIPGVMSEPALNIKQPMVKKPVKFRKPRMVTLQQDSGMVTNSLTRGGGVSRMRRKANHEIDEIPSRDNSMASGNVSLKKASLKDLGPEDKKRVANLVKELAKVGEEREIALTQLTQERIAFEERLQILQEEYDSNINEKLNLQSRFLELQGLLKKYNKNGSDRKKDTFSSGNISYSNHVTQTSPGLIPSPEDVPGNVRQLPGQKSPSKTMKQSVLEDSSHPLIADSGCQFPSPTKMARQSTPLPGNTEADRSMVLPGNGIARSEKGSASNKKETTGEGSFITGNGTTYSRESAQGSEFLPGKVTTGLPQMSSHQQKAGLELNQGSLSVPGNSSGTSVPLPNHVATREVLTEIPTNQQEVAHSIPGKTGNGALDQETGNNLPSYHFLGNVPLPLRSNWPPVYRHPPPASTEQDLPVYANRLFDMSVTRPDALRQGPTTTNRSQSDTSQSFSAELDAVYRLYCREYELQLQLQQQQLELQKQQLQLQQQLQQLEFFHQRQQQQPASFTEKMPKSSSKTIIRETPDPTPAPQPEAQPQRASQMSDLVPTPDDTYDSHRGQSSVMYHQDQGYRDDGEGETEGDEANKTVRRITSSKRPKANTNRERNLQPHEGSYTSTNRNPISRSRDNPSTSHHSLPPSDEQGLAESSRGVSKEFIQPEDAAHFRFSLHSRDSSSLHPSQRQSIPHSTRLDNEVDWTNATDFEFRNLQESKIREHYGLGQRTFHSSQALLDPLEPRVTGARYNLYDSATVAEPVDRRINRDNQVPQGRNGSSIDRHPQGTGTDRQYPPRHSRFDAAPYDISEQELEQKTLQNFSLYGNRDHQNKGASGGACFYGDSNHGNHHEDIEPWVSESSGFQRDRSHSLELNYPLQIIDLVQELEDEPRVSPHPNKPSYSVYLSPSQQDSAAQNGGLDSTDSGFSNVSREKLSPPMHPPRGSEDEAIEELSVLEDIFFI